MGVSSQIEKHGSCLPALLDDEFEMFWRVSGIMGLPPCPLHQHGLGCYTLVLDGVSKRIDRVENKQRREEIRNTLNERVAEVRAAVPTLTLPNVNSLFFSTTSRINNREETRTIPITSEQVICFVFSFFFLFFFCEIKTS